MPRALPRPSDLAELYAQFGSAELLAAYLGVGETTVKKWCREQAVPGYKRTGQHRPGHPWTRAILSGRHT